MKRNAIYQELLEALAEGQAYTLGSLSHHTRLSKSLVEQLLDELEQRGFIAQLGDQCAGGCAGCGLMGTCDAPRPITGWQFTDKELRALRGGGLPSASSKGGSGDGDL